MECIVINSTPSKLKKEVKIYTSVLSEDYILYPFFWVKYVFMFLNFGQKLESVHDRNFDKF